MSQSMPANVFSRFPQPPAARTLGWTLRAVDAAAGTIEVEFDGKADFLNPAGTVQGGFLAAMLDDTMGPALLAMTDGEAYAPTIDLHVSFIRPARPGRFLCKGRVVNHGKTIAFLEGELFDADGELVARANASARVISTAKLGQ